MITLTQATVDWAAIGRTWGPLGIVFVIAVVGIIAGSRMVRSLILGTIEDARKERDYVRQQREREATAFIQSLEKRDELMKDGFDEVLREIRGAPRRR
jgi:hypothetical protein